jgi:uncharacterized protein related to proFAR isomerase
MEIIPIITLKNYKLMNHLISLENISQFIKEEDKLYILDLDGIEKNRTNLELYQKISTTYDLWIDCGPRNFGDIVDIFMTGATSVTIKKALFRSLNISDIRDISENKVYLNLDFQNFEKYGNDDLFIEKYDGFVNFNTKEEIEKNFILHEQINKIKKQNKIYCYENNYKNYLFWEGLGVTGLLVDINKLKEFKNGI